MSTPSKDLIETEGTLRTVIESLIDAQEGLQTIGEYIEDGVLKRFFLAESLKRAQFRGELENILHQEGVRDLHESGSPAGTFVRVWTALKSKLGGGSHTLLATAEEGEKSTLDTYSDALRKGLPLSAREVLATQAVDIQSSYDYIRAARGASR